MDIGDSPTSVAFVRVCPARAGMNRAAARDQKAARGGDRVTPMTHEVIAVLTLLLSLVSAVGVLWIALRLERVAGRLDSVQEDVRSHVNMPGLHAPRQ